MFTAVPLRRTKPSKNIPQMCSGCSVVESIRAYLCDVMLGGHCNCALENSTRMGSDAKFHVLNCVKLSVKMPLLIPGVRPAHTRACSPRISRVMQSCGIFICFCMFFYILCLCFPSFLMSFLQGKLYTLF